MTYKIVILLITLVFISTSNAYTPSEALLAHILAEMNNTKPGLCAEFASALGDFTNAKTCKYSTGTDFDGQEMQWVHCDGAYLKVSKNGNLYARMFIEDKNNRTRIDVRTNGLSCIYAVGGDLGLASVTKLTKQQKNNIQKSVIEIIKLYQSK